MTAKAIAAAKVPATTKAGKGVIAIPVITDLPKPIGHASRHRRDEARRLSNERSHMVGKAP